MSTSIPDASRKKNGCLLWAGIFALVLILAAGIAFYVLHQIEQDNERYFAGYEAQRSQTSYTCTLYPATVAFPRGATSGVDLYGATPWRGLRAEFATCPDDSDGRCYAEFYQTDSAPGFPARAFADETHPAIDREYVRVLEVDPRKMQAGAIILNEETLDGWHLRSTLVPTPHGGAVVPGNLPASVLETLAASEAPPAPTFARGVADPRHSSAASSGSRRFGARTNDDLQREAEARAERDFNASSRTYDEHHHHFYLVEAVRDFGDCRVIALRRFGQVYGEETISRAMSTIKAMTSQVTVPPPASAGK